MTSFIEVYKNALDNETCDTFINLFEENKSLQSPGKAGNAINLDVKKSTDIHINCTYILNNSSKDVMLWKDTTVKFLDSLNHCIELYRNKYMSKIDPQGFVIQENKFNLQKYLVGEGFYEWHVENYSSDTDKRALVFMCYLNDVVDGGTEFDNGFGSTEAKKGNLVLWPPYWTHPHRGIISKTQTKYILTGWLEFYEDNAENFPDLKEFCYD